MGVIISNTVNQQLLAQLQTKLEEISPEDLEAASDETLDSTTPDSGIKNLFGFFQNKFANDPEYAYSEDNRPNLFDIFEEAIQKSLIATGRSKQYDDFPEITVLYFIRDADKAKYTVSEIEDFLQEI